ncbi:MAG: hypothetical protein ACK5Q5_13435 [Planctomycetaceae bacterium]
MSDRKMLLIGRLLLAAALLGTVGSTLRAYPHQLAYFNESAGGPHEGWRHFVGSSFDWGQDALYAIRRFGSSMPGENCSTKFLMPASDPILRRFLDVRCSGVPSRYFVSRQLLSYLSQVRWISHVEIAQLRLVLRETDSGQLEPVRLTPVCDFYVPLVATRSAR